MSFIPQQLAAEGTPMLAFLEEQISLARRRRDRSVSTQVDLPETEELQEAPQKVLVRVSRKKRR